jgi:hypothetical protein
MGSKCPKSALAGLGRDMKAAGSRAADLPAASPAARSRFNIGWILTTNGSGTAPPKLKSIRMSERGVLLEVLFVSPLTSVSRRLTLVGD